MLLSYFNHCSVLGRVAVVYDGQLLRANAFLDSLRERRGNIDGKNDRDSFCSRFFCAFHSSRINFLCFFLTTHLITDHHSLTRDAFGQFLFRCADERRVLNPKTARAHLTSINSNVTFRLESLRSTHILSLSSLFLFVLSVRNCLRIAIFFAFALAI